MSELARGTLSGNRYRLIDEIGSGGMGLVYRARDERTGREVALKALRSLEAEDLYRVRREFRSVADLSHPNLAKLYDLVVSADECFFTMELIHGVEFLEYVQSGESSDPGASSCDYARLRDALRQLASGLQVLHRAGLVHRDIKPSNVLIDEDGRVVILDLGLVGSWLTRQGQESQLGFLVGTYGYMAPEQSRGEAVGPAADWYSVGVMLYQALCGEASLDRIARVRLVDGTGGLPSPRDLFPQTPETLSDLAMELLHEKPAPRPTAAEVLARLGEMSEEPACVDAPSQQPPETEVFVGRAAELEVLMTALAECRQGETSVVRVEGPSGIGKSALVEHFMRAVEDDPDALPLRSRCHPYEAVPLKAIDGLVEELSRFLVRQGPEELEAVTPRHVGVLLKLLPVLGRVPFRLAPSDRIPSDLTPAEMLQRGSIALREILARIADRHPLLLWIDELHWADAESEPLLRSLLEPGEAPAAMWIFSYSAAAHHRTELLGSLDSLLDEGPAPYRHRIELGPLDVSTSRELARVLSGSELRSDRIANASGGSPFLIEALANQEPVEDRAEPSVEQPVSMRIASVIRDQILKLDPDARRLLELVAVSGRPLDPELAARAAGVKGDARDLTRQLQYARLIGSAAVGSEVAVEPYHDRVREAALWMLSKADLAGNHLALGSVLAETAGSEPATVATHLHLGSELDAVVGLTEFTALARETLSRSSSDRSQLRRLYALRAAAHLDLYEGRNDDACRRVEEAWPELVRSPAFTVPVARVDGYFLRARVILARAAATEAPQDRLLRECAADGRRLGREGRAGARGHDCLLRAGIAGLQGQADQARELIDQAISLYQEADLPCYDGYACRRKGELAGQQRGEAWVLEADERLRNEGVAEPESWTSVYAPGFRKT